MINDYDNRVLQLDDQIGNALKTLERKGYLEDALLIITSDHGQALLESNHYWHGKTTQMPETWIPLVLNYTGKREFPFDSISSVNSQIDLAPTVIDLLELPPPGSWKGKSIFSSEEILPVYQSEAGMYSAIFRYESVLLQLTIYENNSDRILYNISKPEEPKIISAPIRLNIDSISGLIRDHYDLF